MFDLWLHCRVSGGEAGLGRLGPSCLGCQRCLVYARGPASLACLIIYLAARWSWVGASPHRQHWFSKLSSLPA